MAQTVHSNQIPRDYFHGPRQSPCFGVTNTLLAIGGNSISRDKDFLDDFMLKLLFIMAFISLSSNLPVIFLCCSLAWGLPELLAVLFTLIAVSKLSHAFGETMAENGDTTLNHG